MCTDSNVPADFREYLLASGGVLRNVVLSYPKTNCEDGIPCVASVRGATGSRQWAHTILDPQSLCVTKCLVYDDDSPNGNPFRATTDRLLMRQLRLLDPLLRSARCLLPTVVPPPSPYRR